MTELNFLSVGRKLINPEAISFIETFENGAIRIHLIGQEKGLPVTSDAAAEFLGKLQGLPARKGKVSIL